MRNIFYLIIIASLLCSCQLKQTIVVNGTSGSTIYDLNFCALGTIGSNGTAKIKISQSTYYSFLFSVSTDGQAIPFGVDFKKKRRTGAMLTMIPCLGIYSPAFYYWVANGQWQDNYSYLKQQKTNEDFQFQPYVETGFKREVLNQTPTSKEMAGTSIGTSLRNLAGNIAGTYTGEGQLLTDKGRTAERYEGLKLQITRVNNHTVTVVVLDENNESYFDEPQQYIVKKSEDGTYVLTLTSDSEAVISINANGTLDYHHPHNSIDAKNYILNISANR